MTEQEDNQLEETRGGYSVPIDVTWKWDDKDREVTRTKKLTWGKEGEKNYGEALLLYNFFSHEECRFLIDETEKKGFNKIRWDQSQNPNLSVNRICDRILTNSEESAEKWYSRVNKFLEKDLKIQKEDDRFYKYTGGTWTPLRINTALRFNRYYPGGNFSAHTDGDYVETENVRSFFTLMVYLNADFTGGSTNFLDPVTREVTQEIKIEEEGMAILFNHNLLHEGAPVATGVKYMVRTDVIYERDASTLPVDSDKFAKADRYLKLADDLERCANLNEAVKYYKLAFRLNPELDKA